MTQTPVRLTEGDLAPDFTLPDANGEPVALTDLLGQGRALILFVYPAAMTPGCTTEACDFRDSVAALQQVGFAVAGLSKDAPARLAQFAEKESLTYPLLSDEGLGTLKAYGAFGEKKNYGRVVQGTIRSTFVIGDDRTIRHAFYNVRAKGHVAKLRRDLGLD